MLDLSAKPAHLRQAQRPDALPAPRTPLDENCTMGAGPGLCVLSVLPSAAGEERTHRAWGR